MMAFGLSYGAASLGCALPLFLSGVASAFTERGTSDGLIAFVSYALGMGTVTTALAVVVALAGPVSVRPLRRISRLVPLLSGVLLGITGLYLTFYWVGAIVQPTRSVPFEAWVSSAQSWLATLFTAHAHTIGVLGGLVVVLALLGLGLGRDNVIKRRRWPAYKRTRAGSASDSEPGLASTGALPREDIADG